MVWENSRLSKRLSLEAPIIEQLYRMLTQIDTVKNTYQVTRHLLPQTLQKLTQSVIVTSTGASNRIEGNLLSDQEVQGIYKNMRIRSFKSRDEQEVVGYLNILQTVFSTPESFSLKESSILAIHQEMLAYSDKDQRHKGQYKFGPNRVEAKDHEGNVIGVMFDPTPPYLVAKEMQELTAWYQWAKDTLFKHPLILIANFIFEYLAIHPFQDGNGRSSRLLTNLMLLQEGYDFTRLVSHERLVEANKAEYYLALNKTQQTWKTDAENIEPWLMFFIEVIQKQAEQAQGLLQGDQFEYLLSDKQLELWHWAKTRGMFTRREAIAALGMPSRTIEQIIKKLCDLQKLERLGQGRATRYQVL